jgi:hypothetical protein
MKRLNPADPLSFIPWYRAMLTAIADLQSMAEDAVAPLAKRRLGRLEHVRILEESRERISDLLIYAQPDLPPAKPEPSNDAK